MLTHTKPIDSLGTGLIIEPFLAPFIQDSSLASAIRTTLACHPIQPSFNASSELNHDRSYIELKPITTCTSSLKVMTTLAASSSRFIQHLWGLITKQIHLRPSSTTTPAIQLEHCHSTPLQHLWACVPTLHHENKFTITTSPVCQR